MKSFSYNDAPVHEHDCNKCEFMFGINFIDEPAGIVTLNVDVYKQCNYSPLGPKYLIRYSSDGPDYHSGVDFKQLVAGYISAHHGI